MLPIAGQPRLAVPVSDRDHMRGPRDAAVTVVVYSDCECPHCGEAYRLLKGVEERRNGLLRLIFRHFPLTAVHPHAQKAAEALEAAAAQNRFWEMHDRLFEHQQQLTLPELSEHARAIQLDIVRFEGELQADTYAAAVRENFKGGVRSGVNGTPSVFINDQRFDDSWDRLEMAVLAGIEAHEKGAAGAGAQQNVADGATSMSGAASARNPSVGRRRIFGRRRFSATEQREMIDRLSNIDPVALTPADLDQLFLMVSRPRDPGLQFEAAALLAQIYPTIAPKNPDFAKKTHTALLRDLRQPRRALAHPACNWLLLTHLQEANLALIPWNSTDEVVSAAECFYGFKGAGLTADQSLSRVRDLVKYAGLHFAREERWEEAFRLLSRIPVSSELTDADLFKLRNSVVLWEYRRVQNIRRMLFGWILLVFLFVLVVAPFIFMSAENEKRLAMELAPLRFLEAQYWSAITFTTVGYGDVVPFSELGRLLAIVIAFSGVTILGVIAGLILSFVTPRQLE